MAERNWSHFHYGADIGVRGIGASKGEAFEQAAVALTAVITDPDKVAPNELVAFKCEARDDALLLADWLSVICVRG